MRFFANFQAFRQADWIAVDEDFIVQNARVELYYFAQRIYLSQIEIVLVAPDGSQAQLINRPPYPQEFRIGANINYRQTGGNAVFDDRSVFGITDIGPSFEAAAMRSQGPLTLAGLRGVRSKGVWSLRIRDLTTGRYIDEMLGDFRSAIEGFMAWQLFLEPIRTQVFLPSLSAPGAAPPPPADPGKLVALSFHTVPDRPDEALFLRDAMALPYVMSQFRPDPAGMRPLGSTWPALAELFPDGVDAAITNRDGTSTAFFKGGTVANFDHTRSRFETDTPEPIGAAWPEFVRAGIDAAALWPITTANPSCSYEFADRAYIFRGDQYIRYNIATGQVANGFPRPIAEGWPGMPFTSIDAVVVWQGPIDNDYRAYFFKGDQYARYNLCLDRTEDGYPRHINDLWLELAPDG